MRKASLHPVSRRRKQRRPARAARVSQRHRKPVPPRPIRILLAKVGLDGHDRGIRVVARALRDAGMEVIYLGLFQTPEMIAAAALQEDPDVIGVSILSGAHLALMQRLAKLRKQHHLGQTPLMLGGIIPDEDIPRLKALGVSRIFLPGARLQEIVEWVKTAVAA